MANSTQGLEIPGLRAKAEVNILLNPAKAKYQKQLEEQLNQFFKATSNPSLSAQKTFLNKLLKAEGYYAAKIHIVHQAETKKHSKRNYSFQVNLGSRSFIHTLSVNFPAHFTPLPLEKLPIKTGDALQAQPILDARLWLQKQVQSRYCLINPKVQYSVVLSRENQSADVIFSLADSTEGFIKSITIKGNKRVKKHYLQNVLPIHKGDCFKTAALDQTRIALFQTGLVSRVTITSTPEEIETTVAKTTVAKKGVDITLAVAERARRTVQTGFAYNTDTKLGIIAGWENRNLFGQADKLSIDFESDQVITSITGEFTRPFFLSRKQNLSLATTVEEEEVDAYRSVKAEASANIERHMNRFLTTNVGAAFAKLSVQNENAEYTEKYDLLSFPLSLQYDRRNDLLNTTKGWTISAGTESFSDLYSQETRFLKNTFSFSTYWTPIQAKVTPTFAVKIDSGSITGAPIDAIPQPERFYVGGGGSVRGYRYKSLGEYVDGEPKGGKSFSSAAIEIRTRFAEHWGFVAFADGGYAYPEEKPAFGDDFLWGAGFGLRYITSFTPFRIDIAFPLDQRENKDDDFQLYIGIGQAF